MAIIVTCDCGKKLKVGDQHAGKKVQCPGCNEVIPVPEAEEEDRGADRFAAALKSGPMSGRRRPPVEDDEEDEEQTRPARKGRSEEDEDEDRPSRRSSRHDDEEEQEEERPRRKKKSRRKPETNIAGAGALIAMGALMMIGAAVWFIVGLLNDYLFYYPPVLFVIGIVTMIRGMMGYSE